MEIDYQELLKKAEYFSKEEIEWHHHYLPPHCLLSSSDKHVIILEAQGKEWKSFFDEKPMEDLEKLENIFFRRS